MNNSPVDGIHQLNNINTIDGMHQFLQEEFSVEISCRGRKFKINGEEFTLNALVKKVQSIASSELPADKTASQQLCDISHRIKQMDLDGNTELRKQNIFLKIATFFRRLFGNLFCNRKAIMAELLQSRLIETFSKIPKEFVQSVVGAYKTIDSELDQLKEENKKGLLQTILINYYRKEDIKDTKKQTEKLYKNLLELYEELGLDRDYKKLFSLIRGEPLHVLFMLSSINDKSFFKDYQRQDFKWNTKEDEKLYLAICKIRLFEFNELSRAVNNLNTCYKDIKKILDVENLISKAIETHEKLKKTRSGDEEKMIKKNLFTFLKKQKPVFDSDIAIKYGSMLVDLPEMCSCKFDLKFIIENLFDKNLHIIFILSHQGNTFANILLNDLDHYLSQEFKWSNGFREKFENLKEFNQRKLVLKDEALTENC
jgi:hypothetical protein